MEFEKKKDASFDPTVDLPETSSEKKEDNIFAELSGDLDFGHDKEEKKVERKKDKLYYLKLVSSVLGVINIVVFIGVIIGSIFVYVQNNSKFQDQPFLDPFCSLLLGDISEKNTSMYCSSVSGLLNNYTGELEKLKKTITDKLSLIINDTYIIENFVNSKEVTFLLANKTTRLQPLSILNDFDKMKNDFSGSDKKVIDCFSITMKSDSVLDITCDVYSSSWEIKDASGNGIVGYGGDRKSGMIEGTSITIAASFLNFIEKNPKYNFQIIDKQKEFLGESIVGEGSYVKKTTLKFKLKYNSLKTNLSL